MGLVGGQPQARFLYGIAACASRPNANDVLLATGTQSTHVQTGSLRPPVQQELKDGLHSNAST